MRKILFTLAVLASLSIADAFAQEREVAIVAHRGFWNCEEAGKAQNSIASLKCAQEAGVWGSEFDVFLTSDEQLVVNHDAVFQGVEIEATPYDEVRKLKLANGEQIPNIDEYLTQGKKCSTTMLIYEVKSHKLSDERQDLIADLSVQKVKEYKLGPDRVAFIAFSYRICKRIAEQMPGYTVQYLSSDKTPETVNADGVNGIDYHGGALKEHQEWVKEAKDLGMSVNVWTVNKEKNMEEMFNMGVNYLTTDNPLKARALMKKMNIKELK
jgi:glycerophosphoryl diester phosphodiesterase